MRNGPSLSILHVLTLSGSHGEYGGPNKVARELCLELKKRGHSVRIFSGAVKGNEPSVNSNLPESYLLVKPLSKWFPTSSLWSSKLIKSIYTQTKSSDIVHVHFARDLIPMTAAIICILLRKPFVTQTHGMVVPDSRISTKLIDSIFTRRILRKSKVNFVLSPQEMREIAGLYLGKNLEILPNGIHVGEPITIHEQNVRPKIIFCSRIQGRKRPDRFIKLANESFARNLNFDFEMYGPDGGELSQVTSSILKENLPNLKYMGSLPPGEVSAILGQSDLLVLPSENEPFPMIVLESLAVGTPVLIMPSCGIANRFDNEFPEFIAQSDDFEGLLRGFLAQLKIGLGNSKRNKIQDFCRREFGIVVVTDQLETMYESLLL